MWFSVACTLIDNRDTRHRSCQILLWTHSAVPRESNLTTLMTGIVVDKNTDHVKPHSICQFEYTQFKLEWKNHTLFETTMAKIDIPISECKWLENHILCATHLMDHIVKRERLVCSNRCMIFGKLLKSLLSILSINQRT